MGLRGIRPQLQRQAVVGDRVLRQPEPRLDLPERQPIAGLEGVQSCRILEGRQPEPGVRTAPCRECEQVTG